jgi:hypothetical protein
MATITTRSQTTIPQTTIPLASDSVSGGASVSGSATSTAGNYEILLNEIKQTIDKNDRLFQQIQQANYPNAGQYTSDLLNYKIDTQVSDLTKTRQTIWDFLNKKYQENTKLRSYYFDEIRKADEHISQLTKQKNDYINSIQRKQTETSTAAESIRHQKYEFEKKQYYLFLYKLLVLVQIIILAVITLCITNIIPISTALVIIVIILIATLGFVGYYVFYVNVGRNKFSWPKVDHTNDIKSSSKICDSSNVSQEDKQKASVNSAVQAIIDKNVGKCNTSK